VELPSFLLFAGVPPVPPVPIVKFMTWPLVQECLFFHRPNREFIANLRALPPPPQIIKKLIPPWTPLISGANYLPEKIYD